MNREVLVGVAEIADLFGVSRQAASNWRERHADFPTPAASLKSGPVWELPDILAWADEREMQVKTAEAEVLGSGAGTEATCVVVALVNMKGRGRQVNADGEHRLVLCVLWKPARLDGRSRPPIQPESVCLRK